MSFVIDSPPLVPAPISPASRYGFINALLDESGIDRHVWTSFLPDDDTGITYNLPTCTTPPTVFDPLCDPTGSLPKSDPIPVYREVQSQVPIFWEVASFCSTVPKNEEADIKASAYNNFNGSLELALEREYRDRFPLTGNLTFLPGVSSILCAYGKAILAASELPGPSNYLIHVDRVTALALLDANAVEVKNGKLYDKITGSLVVVWRSQPQPNAIVIETESRARLWLSDWIEIPTPSDEVARTNTRVFRVERGALLIGPEASCIQFVSEYTCP